MGSLGPKGLEGQVLRVQITLPQSSQELKQAAISPKKGSEVRRGWKPTLKGQSF